MIQIDACKKGDKEALGELYTTYAKRLLGVCRHYVKDDNVAEDILHDAFIIIFMSIQDLKDESKLEGWMVTIVRNLSLKYFQSTEKETIPLSCLDIEIKDEVREEQKSIELGLLLSAIESLPKGNREVFKLSVLDGLSHKEIGELLGINPHSSSSQLFRAKKMLRTILINYWMLLLLPILIPVYVYFITRDKTIESSDSKRTAENTYKELPKRLQKEAQPRYSLPLSTDGNVGHTLTEIAVPVEDISSQVITDSVEAGQQTVSFNVDSLEKHLAINGISTGDSMLHFSHISEEKILALNESMHSNASNNKKYPWIFNFGYSSNAGANGGSVVKPSCIPSLSCT